MQYSYTILLFLSFTSALLASPIRRDAPTDCVTDSSCGPIPGESSLYSDYMGTDPPFPANMTSAVPATTTGPAGEDDVVFQNLLSAEWAVFSFYQQGVEAFNQSVFTDLGLPNTTYQRITEIRDNEAGHLRIFQDSISSTSVKPGICSYDFGWSDAMGFLALQNIIEVSSMAFATGLAQQAKSSATIGALVGIGETETRHEVNPSIYDSGMAYYTLIDHLLDLGSHRCLGSRSLCGCDRHRVRLRKPDPLHNFSRFHRRRKLSHSESPLPISSAESTPIEL